MGKTKENEYRALIPRALNYKIPKITKKHANPWKKYTFYLFGYPFSTFLRKNLEITAIFTEKFAFEIQLWRLFREVMLKFKNSDPHF